MFDEVFEGPKGPFVLLDYAVSLLAIVSNIVVLDAIVRSYFSLKGYRRFLISLTMSDLYICGINLLFFVFQMSPLFSNDAAIASCGMQILRSLQLVGFFANLLNLCGMSIDHVIGLVYPLKYQYLTRKKFAQAAVICVWIISFFLGFLDVPVTALLYLFGYNKSGPSLSPGQTSATSCVNPALLDMFNDLRAELQMTVAADWASGDDIKTTTEALKTAAGWPATVFSGDKKFPLDYLKKRRRRSQTLMPRVVYSYQNDVTDQDVSGEGTTTMTPIAFFLNESGFTAEVEAPLVETSNIVDEIMSNFSEINEAICGIRKNGATSFDGLGYFGSQATFCSQYKNGPFLEYFVIALTLSCFVFLAICYRKIFVTIFASNSIPITKRKTSKLVITTCFLLGAFSLSYLPFMLFEFTMSIVMTKNFEFVAFLRTSRGVLILHNVLNSLLLAYPLLDPIIYAARLPSVKKHIFLTLAMLVPCCRRIFMEKAARHASLMSSASSASHWHQHSGGVTRTPSDAGTTRTNRSNSHTGHYPLTSMHQLSFCRRCAENSLTLQVPTLGKRSVDTTVELVGIQKSRSITSVDNKNNLSPSLITSSDLKRSRSCAEPRTNRATKAAVSFEGAAFIAQTNNKKAAPPPCDVGSNNNRERCLSANSDNLRDNNNSAAAEREPLFSSSLNRPSIGCIDKTQTATDSQYIIYFS